MRAGVCSSRTQCGDPYPSEKQPHPSTQRVDLNILTAAKEFMNGPATSGVSQVVRLRHCIPWFVGSPLTDWELQGYNLFICLTSHNIQGPVTWLLLLANCF